MLKQLGNVTLLITLVTYFKEYNQREIREDGEMYYH